MHRLHIGGLFKLIDWSILPHSVSMRPAALLDTLTSNASLHSALGSSRRRAFHARLERLTARHFAGQEEVELPLHTKVYLLAKQAKALPRWPPAAHAGGGRTWQAATGALEAERVCLFCGSPAE